MKRFRVIWDSVAISELKDIYDCLHRDSPQSALIVRDELVKTVGGLSTIPRKFQVYEYANPLLGEYCSVVRWSYRIVYEIIDSDVHIVRIIHTSRESGKIIL
ncbi:MAG: type II toxin-antitoxin system RelE/ParE family toxin [Bacteroidetes bacterium]|nr:type II toxin-antitoxin system RelE/ParE family toxin [Bacteroidota bacterium]